MKLYKYKYAITVAPGRNTQEATDKYILEMDNGCAATESDFEVVVTHEDFVKLFRLARLLDSIDQFQPEDIEPIISTYAKRLGYELTESELWHGILKWVERFSEVDDEDIVDWLN